MLSCIGFGLAQTYWQALLYRTLGGMLNGNVGVMRTMIAEIIEEKKCVISGLWEGARANIFADISLERF